jgi:DNA ligase-1
MGRYLVHKPIEFEKLSAAWKKKQGVTDIDGLGNKFALQNKYDGCHVIVKLLNQQAFEIISRTGEKVRSMDHVGRMLLKLWHPLLAKGQSFAVMGEAWAKGVKQTTASGWFRSHDPQPALRFAGFDMMPLADFEAGRCEVPYQSRYAHLMHHLRGFTEADTAFLCPLYMPGTYGRPTDRAAELQKLGSKRAFDGAILRDLDAGWVAGAGSNGAIIKVKPRPSFDLRIIGVEEGLGKYAGTVGKVVLQFKDGTVIKAAGGTDDERARWWKSAHNPDYDADDYIIDRIGEVTCLERYASGELREPVFKGVRYDKVDID